MYLTLHSHEKQYDQAIYIRLQRNAIFFSLLEEKRSGAEMMRISNKLDCALEIKGA